MAAIKSEMPPLHAAEALVGAAGVGGGGGGSSVSGSGSVANSSSANGASVATNSNSSANAVNNTISAAADSSDNQPSTPQPQQIIGNDQQQQSAASIPHHPYAAHHMYASASTGTTTTAALPHMYSAGVYATAGQDMQQQQQQVAAAQQQHIGYPSYLNSYEQFYQQQAAQSQTGGNLDYGNPSVMYGNASGDYKSPNVRYHPYLQAPTSGIPSSSNGGNGSGSGADNNSDAHESSNAAVVSSASMVSLQNSSAAVSTTTAMSPRVVSSTSPTSTSSNLQLGNPNSPGNKLQCKKCGIMCTNESELQEHITNVHGASPYGSSGYSSSPYIKDEVGSQQGTSTPIQHQSSGGNPGNLLDLDSQKMVYPPPPGSMQALLHHPHQQLHDSLSASDPLHSMHSMQQRALPGWSQQAPTSLEEGLPPYMQSQPPEASAKTHANQSPYYSPKQSPYHISAGGTIKQEYPIIKSEYADSQNYLDKSFDPTAGEDLCSHPPPPQQSQQMMPVSSSPAEFPSTTTGPHDQQQQYRGFEPPSSSSVLPASNITAKAATWKSNEARRPKTYNCTACNKWFTSSGHLKRHYNTTLHKNAVKSSGQPDPATLPISAHHHPARDPSGKQHRRSNSAASAGSQQQQPPAPVQPPEPPRSPPDYAAQAVGMGQMSHYSTSPSPTHTQQTNGMSYAQVQQNGYSQSQSQYMQQVQSTTNASPQHASNNLAGNSPTQQTVLNGHPNGLAGPSAQATPAQIPSSHTRGLLNTTTTVITKIETMEDNSNTLTGSQMDMGMGVLQHRGEHQLGEEAEQRHQHPLQHQQGQLGMLETLEEAQHPQYHQLEPLALEHQRQYHNSTPSSTHSMQAQSPLIISHQQYQEQLQQQQPPQPMGDIIFSHTPPLQPRQVHMLQHNIMDQQYNIIPLAISTPQHNSNMQLLQQPQHTTTNTATTNMGSIRTMARNPLHQQQLEQQRVQAPPLMHNTLHHSTNIQSPLDTISTTITHTPPPQPIITTTQPQLQLPPLQQQQHTTNTIPCFQQLHQQASGLGPLDHTMTYHTIIGSNANGLGNTTASELLQLATLDSYGNLQPQQMLTTADGQILQFIPTTQMVGQHMFTLPTRAAVAETYAPLSHYSAQRSPQEADLPPTQSNALGAVQTQESQTLTVFPSMPYSPTISSSTLTAVEEYSTHLIKQEILSPNAMLASVPDSSPAPIKKQRRKNGDSNCKPPPKRKRTSSSTLMSPSKATLPTGRIRCLECDKEFTKICYLTQHNKSFHSGEYPFRCQKCGKRFQAEDVYTIHLDRHKSLDKPHKCNLCPKQFHHKTDLRRHIEAIHTGLKQHSCGVCKKSFCRKDHLRKHLETHNRPRTVTKKASKKGAAGKTSKKKKLFDETENQLNARVDDSEQNMLGDVQIKAELFGNSSPSAATIDMPSHDELHDDVVADDESLLEDDDDDDTLGVIDDRGNSPQQQHQLANEMLTPQLIKEEFSMIEHEIALH